MKEHILEIFLLRGKCSQEFITNHIKVMASRSILKETSSTSKGK
jgi:hypothetical protein